MHWLPITVCLAVVTSAVAETGPARRKRTSYEHQCPRGCSTCSTANGCVMCRPRFFLYLRRTHMRQTGVCLLSCPLHYYGTRSRDFKYCAKCKINKCEVCFNKNYCGTCAEGYVEHRGQCVDQCPEGTSTKNETRQCLPKVDCVVGNWGPWGVCTKKGHTCGFKYGIQTRTREIVKFPSSSGGRCPYTTDNRRCRMLHRICPEIISNESEFSQAELKNKRRGNKKKEGKKRQRKRKKNKLRRCNATAAVAANVSNNLDKLLI